MSEHEFSWWGQNETCNTAKNISINLISACRRKVTERLNFDSVRVCDLVWAKLGPYVYAMQECGQLTSGRQKGLSKIQSLLQFGPLANKAVCIVVVVLCVLLYLSCVYCCHLMCICCTVCALQGFFCTLDAGLLARSQYSEGPATGHLDTCFSWFPYVYKQMPRRLPRFQVATTCFSCSPPDLNLLVTNFMFCIHVK